MPASKGRTKAKATKESKGTKVTKVYQKRGHPRSIDWKPKEGKPEYRGKFFLSALDDLESEQPVMPMTTLRELTMMRFMNKVTDMPEWTEKISNESLVAEWKEEETKPGRDVKEEMTPAMFDYCVAELRDRVARYGVDAPIKVLECAVYKSDTAVSEETKQALKKAVKVLEDVPEKQKDWREGSNKQILDLVHPSLFPAIYGKTRILAVKANATTLDDCIKRSGEGEVLEFPKQLLEGESIECYSKSFQWLPSEVDISGEKSMILTYINNLHPKKHQGAYQVIENVVDAVIPLWNLTLAPQTQPAAAKKKGDEDEDEEDSDDNGDDDDDEDGDDDEEGGGSESPLKFTRRIRYKCEYKRNPQFYSPEEAEEEYDQDEDLDEAWNEESGGQDPDDDPDAYEEWREKRRIVVLPDAPEYTPTQELEPFDLKAKYGKLPLQIIVKMVNVELTPENPEYAGGTWHVEGRMNECICASALYYYSTENVTKPRLSFRHFVTDDDLLDIDFPQEHRDWVEPVYGMAEEEEPESGAPARAQYLGDVATPEGRLITYSSLLHYRVEPFELADRTKPGHRKLLALFLVDPNIPIISTADVPCQRRDWWAEEVMSAEGSGATLGKLPVELKAHVVDAVEDFPLSLESGKEYRLEMTKELQAFAELAHRSFDHMPFIFHDD